MAYLLLDFFGGHIAACGYCVPMHFVHMVSWTNTPKGLAQKIGLEGVAFHINMQAAVSFVNHGENFLVGGVAHGDPNAGVGGL